MRDRPAGSRRPPAPTTPRAPSARRRTPALPTLAAQLRGITRAGGDGVLRFPDGRALPVTSLDRPVFPDDGITKGDLLRYYVRVAEAAVPPIAGRAIVLTRWPHGIDGPAFHQHDPGEHPPEAVDVALLPTADGSPARRIVGSLPALLWAVQLGAVGVDAWHARVGTPDTPDYAVLDLDPGPDVPFADVVRLARLVVDVLRERGHGAVVKTSGSRGIHLLTPLPPRATWDGAAELAESVAVDVVRRAPTLATVERSVHERPARTIYVDHLQNARGKTLAAAFTVRARPGASVSTPLAPTQLRPTLDPRRLSVATIPGRLAATRRRWAEAWAAAAPRGAWRPTP